MKAIRTVLIGVLILGLMVACGQAPAQEETPEYISEPEPMTEPEIEESTGSFSYELEPVFEESLQQEGFYQMVVTGRNSYLIAEEYISFDNALAFIEKNEAAVKAVNAYFSEIGADVDRASLTYRIHNYSESQVVREGIRLAGVAEGTCPYLSLYVEAALTKPTVRWTHSALGQAVLAYCADMDPQSVSASPESAQDILRNTDYGFLVNLDSVYLSGNGETGRIGRVLAGSFGEFLVDTYGLDALVSAYNDLDTLETAFGGEFTSLRDEWLADLGFGEDEIRQMADPVLTHIPTASEEAQLEAQLTENGGYVIYETDQAIYHFEAGYLTTQEIWNFVVLNEEAADEIRDFLGEEFTEHEGKLEYQILSGTGASMAANDGAIVLNRVKEQAAEYAHETTHTLSGYHNPLWLSEGLASYVDWLYTEFKSPPHYLEDLDALAYTALYVEDYMNILNFSDDIFIAADRIRPYAVAGSFAKYVDENYGREALLRIYTDYNNFESIMGTDITTVREAWLEYLRTNY